MSHTPKAKLLPSKKSTKSPASKTGYKTDWQTKPHTANADKITVPSWIGPLVFSHANLVAWEGTLSPLRTSNLYPLHGTFLDTIISIQKNGIIRWKESLHPLDKNRVLNLFAESNTCPFSVEYRLVDKSGAIAWVRHSIISTIKLGAHGTSRGFIYDIQKEKELELESLRVSEREQNRIGQDLHDDLCQVLAGVSCLLRVAEDRLAAKAPEEVAGLSELNQQIIEAMHRTRALTHGLFPGKIQVADVRGALLELAAQVRARFQIEVKTEFQGRFPKHTSNQIIQIYRLAQEAISNAIKHGRATSIEVLLEAKPTTMLLSIIDNGSGMTQSEPGEKGVGLNIMQYRTSTLGGELQIGNEPGRGVAVRLHYPF